jgi:hypothetical protein
LLKKEEQELTNGIASVLLDIKGNNYQNQDRYSTEREKNFTS